MGSATREALVTAGAALTAHKTVTLQAGEQLLDASLVLAGSPQLRSALADDTAEVDNKVGIVAAVFHGYTPVARRASTRKLKVTARTKCHALFMRQLGSDPGTDRKCAGRRISDQSISRWRLYAAARRRQGAEPSSGSWWLPT